MKLPVGKLALSSILANADKCILFNSVVACIIAYICLFLWWFSSDHICKAEFHNYSLQLFLIEHLYHLNQTSTILAWVSTSVERARYNTFFKANVTCFGKTTGKEHLLLTMTPLKQAILHYPHNLTGCQTFSKRDM